jgi:hypothetical protein
MEGPNENCHHLAEAALSPKRHPGDTLAGILRLGPPLGLLAALLRVGMAAGPRGADWDLPPPCRDRCDDPDWTKRAAPCAGPGIAQNAPSAHSFRAPFGVPDLYQMAKPRRVAIPVAEDRRLHAVLNGKNGTASARTVQLSKISPMPIGLKARSAPPTSSANALSSHFIEGRFKRSKAGAGKDPASGPNFRG